MIRRLCVTVVAATGLAWGVAAHAQKAHQHGHAKLDVVYEAGQLTIELDSPLDNLVGFERAPRTDAERKTVDAAVARLRAGQTLFVIDPAAGCTLGAVELSSAPLGLGGADAAPARDGHAELAARWDFRCDGVAPGWIDVGLFQAFRRLSRLEVQAVGPRAQRQATLRRAAAPVRLELPR
jgi:hypothetical protein